MRLDHHTNSQAWRGNNLMVWGCMGWNRVGKLIEVQGKKGMLSNVVRFWRRVWRRASKHCRWLRMGVGWVLLPAGQWSKTHLQKGISVVFWQQHHSHEVAFPIPWFKSNWTPLATSQDQTPTIWYTTQRCMTCGIGWQRSGIKYVPPETWQTLIETMPRRIQAVLKTKGGHTKY